MLRSTAVLVRETVFWRKSLQAAGPLCAGRSALKTESSANIGANPGLCRPKPGIAARPPTRQEPPASGARRMVSADAPGDEMKGGYGWFPTGPRPVCTHSRPEGGG